MFHSLALQGAFLAPQAPRDALAAGPPLVLALAPGGAAAAGHRAADGGGCQAAAPGAGAATPGDADARVPASEWKMLENFGDFCWGLWS